MRKYLQSHTSAGLLIAAILLATPLTATPASAKDDSATQEFLAQLAEPPSAQACPNRTEYYTYYSNASKTQAVGWCEYGCYCTVECEGQKTQYYTYRYVPGCL